MLEGCLPFFADPLLKSFMAKHNALSLPLVDGELFVTARLKWPWVNWVA